MRIRIQNEWRNQTVFTSLLVMLAALFFSRALLSVSLIVFSIATLAHPNFLQQVKKFLSNYFLTGISLLFFIPFVSGLWSANLVEWSHIVRIKLPLLIFPLAFAGSWQLKEKQWLQTGLFFLALVFLGVCWSLFHYLSDMKAIHEGYLKAGVIMAPLENDHIRFSWIVTVAILLCLLLAHNYTGKSLRIVLLAIAAFFAIYLHILSARTGLITFYLVLTVYILWLLLRLKNTRLTIAGLAALIVLPVLSWLLLPTFQNRIRYLLYDASFIRSNTYQPGSNDGNRFLSIKASWNILQQHPFGIGSGDIRNEVNQWYAVNVPGMLNSDKLYPSSEWLVYGCMAGWIGIILFTIAVALPFFLKGLRHRFFWIAFNCTAVFSFLFDVGLEGQYGIFLYCFILFWWWKWFGNQNRKEVI
jgi:O-antigen ligase